MEAALRTAYELYTGKTLPRLEFDAVRGDVNAIREATIDLDGTPLKVAVANGLKNAEEIIRRVERGEADYIFIEIMACPGGCIGGGGQPIGTNNAVRASRPCMRSTGASPCARATRTRRSRPSMRSSSARPCPAGPTSCSTPTITPAPGGMISPI